MNRPWLKKYPIGIPAEINADQYHNLWEMIEETLKKYHELPAFTCMGKTLSFEQINTNSLALGAFLQSKGLERGDKVAIMMPNLLQYPIALFACLRAGLVVVNTNPLYTPREMRHQFADSDAKAIIICENFASNLQEVLPDTQIKTVIVTSIGEMLGLKGLIVNFVVRNVKKMVPSFSIPNTISFTKAIQEGKKLKLKALQSDPEDVIILQYTGGTTGVSKGAMLTNRNLVANMMQNRAIMMPFLKEAEGLALCCLPLYHIFAFTVNCLTLMGIGMQNILVTNARDIPSVAKEFQNNRITVFTGVNTLFNALLNNPAFTAANFKSLKITVGGAMAVQKAVAERWKQVTGCNLAEGYGMTESSPVASCNPLDGTGKIGTIGLPVPSTDFRIVADDGKVLGFDEVGEIQIKGPQVMKGYYKKPEDTAKTIQDGWLSTGDIGKMAEDGFIQIVDRKKDMILVSGFNVYPNEIEDVIAMMPKVLEVAAIGVVDEKSGELPKAYIVKKDDSLTEEEVIAHCRENLTNYKVPRYIEFRKELPKTNVGKILRRQLREEEDAKNAS
ncbi:MAG: AMP-binding protein [Saprospiraceae bacterium]